MLKSTMAIVTPTIATLVLVAGCAKNPDTIAALTLPSGTYADRNCDQLATERASEQRKLAELSKAQRKAQTADTVGVLLVGVPVGSVGGADRETEIASTKGKLEALRRQRARKKCG